MISVCILLASFFLRLMVFMLQAFNFNRILLRTEMIYHQLLCYNRHGCCKWSCLKCYCISLHLYWLHSTASSSDLYRSAKFRVQRTCGVEQFATRLAREYVTVYVQDETEDASAQTITMTTKTTRRCCGVFRDFGAVI